ncbi:MAG: FAD-dependent monooxygenase [Bacteroidia bacterium]
MNRVDVLVVGSGCTGAMAAQTLVEKGVQVLMLDGGKTNQHQSDTTAFIQQRITSETQHETFLGKNFESLPKDEIGTGAQLTPGRQHLIAEVEKFLPLISETFSPMESLAYGGLGGGWGLGSCVFSDQEMQLAGLPVTEMREAYQTVANRIGLSGTNDDARLYTSSFIEGVQQATPTDDTASFLLKKYAAKKEKFNQSGFFLGRPCLALLTEDKENRKSTQLRDMDFYDDDEKAAYRPWITIDALKKAANFSYEGGWLVTHFAENESGVDVEAQHLETGETKIFLCKRLVLASGVLGTARIVMRSHAGGFETQLPILCNPYTYMPCIMPSRFGKTMPEKNIGFAQLGLFHDAGRRHDDVAMASIYSYRSLLLFRLIRETPLNTRDARTVLQYLLPAMLIAGIHHPEKYSDGQFLHLQKNASTPTNDMLHVAYERSEAQVSHTQAREKMYAQALRKMGAWKLKIVHPGHGSSIHYAGALPYSSTAKPFSLALNGLLHGTKYVYVADGSGMTFLPAKGLTLSLMANAHRIAKSLI